MRSKIRQTHLLVHLSAQGDDGSHVGDDGNHGVGGGGGGDDDDDVMM